MGGRTAKRRRGESPDFLDTVRLVIQANSPGQIVPVAGDEVKSALAPVLYSVTGALVADRTMAEQGGGSAHLGGDENNDDDGAPPRTQ